MGGRCVHGKAREGLLDGAAQVVLVARGKGPFREPHLEARPRFSASQCRDSGGRAFDHVNDGL
jgi:hypothetical protein